MTNDYYTIAFDTICEGYQPVMEDTAPILFGTEQEAINEIESDPEFYDGCFPVLLSEIGYKTIYFGGQ